MEAPDDAPASDEMEAAQARRAVPFYCIDVLPAEREDSVVLVGKLEDARAVCVQVRSVRRLRSRVLGPADSTEAGTETGAGAVVAGETTRVSERRIYDARGASARVRVLESVTEGGGAAAWARPGSEWHCADATPLCAALFRSALRQGPGWLTLTLDDDDGVRALSSGAPLAVASLDSLACTDTTAERRALPAVWRLVSLALLAAADGDAPSSVGVAIVTAEAPAPEGPWSVTARTTVAERAATSPSGDAAPPAASARLRQRVAAHIGAAAPDFVLCYDAPRVRALVGTARRDPRIAARDPRPAPGAKGVAAARGGDGYLWADARALGEEARDAAWHDEARYAAELVGVGVGAGAAAGAAAAVVDTAQAKRQRLHDDAGRHDDAAERDAEQRARAWIRLVERDGALRVAHDVAEATGALWRFALAGQRLLIAECAIAREHIRSNYVLPPIAHAGLVAAFGEARADEAAAERAETDGKRYVGARVLKARVGVHGSARVGTEHIVRVDAASLYPSVIQEYSLDYDTHAPCLLPELQRRLVQARAAATLSRHVHRAKALKLASNSIYGAVGSEFFVFYSRRLAGAITAAARGVHEKLEEQARQWCRAENQRLKHAAPARDGERSGDDDDDDDAVEDGDEPCAVLSGDTDAISVRTPALESANEAAAALERHFYAHYDVVRVRADALLSQLVIVSDKSYVGIDAATGATVECGCAPVRGEAGVVAAIASECIGLVLRGDTAALRVLLEGAEARVRAAPLRELVCFRRLGQAPSAYDETARRSQPHVAVALAPAHERAHTSYGRDDHVPYVVLHSGDAPGAVVYAHPAHARRLLAESSATPAHGVYIAHLCSAVRPLCEAAGAGELLRHCLGVAAPRARRPRTMGSAFSAAAGALNAPLTQRALGDFTTGAALPHADVRTTAWRCEARACGGEAALERRECVCARGGVAALEPARKALVERVSLALGAVAHDRARGASAREWLYAHALVDAFEREFSVVAGATGVAEHGDEVRGAIQTRVGAVVFF